VTPLLNRSVHPAAIQNVMQGGLSRGSMIGRRGTARVQADRPRVRDKREMSEKAPASWCVSDRQGDGGMPRWRRR